MNKKRISVIVSIFLLLLQTYLFIIPVGAQKTELHTVAPIMFAIESTGDDFTLPALNPIGIKEDSKGNIHTWLYYGHGSSVQIYYMNVLTNGSTQHYQIDSQTALPTAFGTISLTLGIFFRQELVETADGSIMGIFLKGSLFGTSLRRFFWNPETGLSIDTIKVPNEVEFNGPVIGPIQNDDYVEYYFPGKNTTDDSGSLFKLTFTNTRVTDFSSIKYPIVVPQSSPPQPVIDIFDIGYANNSKFLLSAVMVNTTFATLTLLEETQDNTFEVYSQYPDLNAFPAFDFMLTDMTKPSLAITTSGKIYSFIFGGEVHHVMQWKNQSIDILFTDLKPDPFEFAFFPVIEAYKNEIRIASTGFDFAQDIFTLSADLFVFTSGNDTLIRHKYRDFSFSTTFFFFTLDLKSPSIFGLVTTTTTPDFIISEYKILNDTVGTAFIISDQSFPKVSPLYLDIMIETEEVSTFQDELNNLIVIAIFITSFITIITGVVYWRKKALQFPVEIQELELVEREKSIAFNFISNTRNIFYLWIIHVKTNWKRLISSFFVLILPSLILMSLLIGLNSHQANLIHSYETQNPLNDGESLNFGVIDFKWIRTIYDDELANNTISENEWKIPKSLSQSFAIRYGVYEISTKMSEMTIIQLSEKRQITVPDEDNASEEEVLHYPFPHNISIIEDDWVDYLNSQLVNGRLPEKPGEVLLQQNWFMERDVINSDMPYGVIWDLNSSIELYGSTLDVYLNTSMVNLSQNISVVGVVRKVESLSFSSIKEWAERLNTTVTGLRLLDSVPFYMTSNVANTYLDSFIRLSIIPQTFVSVRYNIADLPREKIPDLISNFETLGNKTLQETGFLWIGSFSDTRITEFLQGFFNASRDLQLEGTLLAVPVLVLLLLLTYGALGMTKSSTQEEIQRFRKEGMRTELQFILFVGEKLLSTALAVTFSAFLVPITVGNFLLFTGFFEMNPSSSPPVSVEFLWIIFIGTFIILSFVNIFLCIRWLLEDQDWRYSRVISGIKGDVILILIGLIMAIGANFLATIFQDQISIDNSVADPTTELMIITLRMFALLIAAFGAMIVLSKVLNRLFISLSSLGWKYSHKPRSLLFKGINRHMGIYGNALLIFIISLFLIIPMFIVPPTIEQKYKNEGYNELGTDIIVDNWETIPEDIQTQITNFNKIKNLTPFFFDGIAFANTPEIRIFALDPAAFLNSVFVPRIYESELGFEFNSIFNLKNGSTMMNKEFLDDNALKKGDNIILEFPHIEETYPLTIIGSFDQFPVLKHELIGQKSGETDSLQMVISLSTLTQIGEKFSKNATDNTLVTVETLQQRKAMIKVKEFGDIDNIATKIKEISGAKLEIVTQIISSQRHPFFRTFEFIIHISVIVATLTPVLYAYILLDILFERRKNELEVYHRTGTTPGYFNSQLSLELIFSVIIPSMIGVLIGFWWSTTSGPEFFGEDTKNLVWVFNGFLIVIWTLIILAFVMIVWMLKINRFSKRHLEEVRV